MQAFRWKICGQKISYRNCNKPRDDMIYYCPDSVVIQAYFYLHTVNFPKQFPFFPVLEASRNHAWYCYHGIQNKYLISELSSFIFVQIIYMCVVVCSTLLG